MFRVSDLIPDVAGANVTAIVQDAATANGVTQGDGPPATPEKSGPLVVGGRVMPTGDEVLFVTVTNWGCEDAPTNCNPKLRLVGETEMFGSSGNSATNAFIVVLFKVG